MRKVLLVIIQLILLCQISPAFCDTDDTDNEETDEAPQKTVTSMEAYSELGKQTANSLSLAAEYALDQGNIDMAIKWCRMALDKGLWRSGYTYGICKSFASKAKKHKRNVILPSLMNV